LTVVEMMDAAYDGRVKGLYILGENPMISDPDSNHVEKARDLPAGLDQISSVMHALKQNGFLSRSSGRWLLARDLTAASLDDLLMALDLTLEPGEGWPDGVGEIVTGAGELGSAVKGKSLAALIDKASASEPPLGVARLHPAPQDER